MATIEDRSNTQGVAEVSRQDFADLSNLLEIRRFHLRQLMDEKGANNIAAKLGYRQSSFLSQMAGKNPTRNITEKSARAFEVALELPVGYFDRPISVPGTAPATPLSVPSAVPMPVAASPAASTGDMLAMVLAATRQLGAICEAEKINLPTPKFASVLQLVLKDAADHGGTVREDHVRDVLALLK